MFSFWSGKPKVCDVLHISKNIYFKSLLSNTEDVISSYSVLWLPKYGCPHVSFSLIGISDIFAYGLSGTAKCLISCYRNCKNISGLRYVSPHALSDALFEWRCTHISGKWKPCLVDGCIMSPLSLLFLLWLAVWFCLCPCCCTVLSLSSMSDPYQRVWVSSQMFHFVKFQVLRHCQVLLFDLETWVFLISC